VEDTFRDAVGDAGTILVNMVRAAICTRSRLACSTTKVCEYHQINTILQTDTSNDRSKLIVDYRISPKQIDD
jgi:hypothetical protein